jgi:hypothetical protein
MPWSRWVSSNTNFTSELPRLYNEAGDVLYATRDLLAVHTVSGGDRTFSLPREVEVVYDLFERRTVARNTNKIGVKLPSASTAFYYTGTSDLLRVL